MESTSYKKEALRSISLQSQAMRKSGNLKSDTVYGSPLGENCKNGPGDTAKIMILTLNSFTCLKTKKRADYTYTVYSLVECRLVGGKIMLVNAAWDLNVKDRKSTRLLQSLMRDWNAVFCTKTKT